MADGALRSASPSILDVYRDEEIRRRRLAGEDSAAPNFVPEDLQYFAEHPGGYGTVDAPSPAGYNRDAFTAEHPGYSGGYYDQTTGRYDGADEAPPSVGSLDVQRGSTGQGLENHTADMGNLPTGGNGSDAVTMSESQDASMPGAGGQSADEPPPSSSYADAVSTYQENNSTSDGS